MSSDRTGAAASSLVRTAHVALPLLVGNIAQLLQTSVDSALVARVSTTMLAALAVVTPLYLVAVMAVLGWATATRTLAAQWHGRDEPEQVRGVLLVAAPVGLGIGLIVGGALAGVTPALLGLLTRDPEMVEAGRVYLWVLALSLPVVGLTAMLEAVYVAVGRARVSMVATLVVLAVDVPAGAVLIFIAGWGVVGAAGSTVLGTVVGCAFLLWWGRRRLRHVVGRSRGSWRRCWPEVGPKLWSIGWPETTSLVLGFLSGVVLVSFAARLGTSDVAAWRITGHVSSVLFLVTYACGTATSTLVGQRLGADDAAGIRAYQRAGWQLAALLAALVALPVLIAPDLVLGVFSPDQTVVAIAAVATLPVLAAVPLMVVGINLAGVLRAAGDTRSVMYAMVLASYLMVIPLAWLLHRPLGVTGIFLASSFGYWVVRLTITWLRYRRGQWRHALVGAQLTPAAAGKPRDSN